jgi:hypothetical protein
VDLQHPKQLCLVYQLCKAKSDVNRVVLMPHSAQAMQRVVAKDKELEDAIRYGNVVAVFSSHIHYRYGQGMTQSENKYCDIAGRPIVYIGSPSFKKFTNLDFKGDGTGFTHEIVDYKGGNRSVIESNFVSSPTLNTTATALRSIHRTRDCQEAGWRSMSIHL